MKPEEQEPVFKTCLGAPIGVALMIWAVLRLILVIGAVIYYGYYLLMLIAFGYIKLFASLSVFMILPFIGLVADIPCLIILMVGVCKKRSDILKPMYFYEIYVLCFEASIVLVVFYIINMNVAPRAMEYILPAVIGFIILSVDTAVTLALKSLLSIIRIKEQPEVVKINGEDQV